MNMLKTLATIINNSFDGAILTSDGGVTSTILDSFSGSGTSGDPWVVTASSVLAGTKAALIITSDTGVSWVATKTGGTGTLSESSTSTTFTMTLNDPVADATPVTWVGFLTATVSGIDTVIYADLTANRI